MSEKKYRVSISEANISPEFVYTKNNITTLECRELISEATVGAKDVVVFRVIFGPDEVHSKHCHKNCTEIVYCISGRGAEGLETEEGVYREYEYAPGVIMYVPKGVSHYTRNLDKFDKLELLGIFLGVPNMEKITTGYESRGEVFDCEKVLK